MPLIQLNLVGNEIGDSGASGIAEVLKLSFFLKTLNLNGKLFSDQLNYCRESNW